MKSLQFTDSQRTVPIGKIVCIGRNYAEHAKEMHSEVGAEPVIFLKPSTAVISDGMPILLPAVSKDVNHEVELIVAIGRTGKGIRAAEALSYVAGYGVGLDMTLRDLQAEAKRKGLPWSVAKGFDTSAPISRIIPASAIGDPQALTISCTVNGVLRQRASTSKMIFPVSRMIEFVSAIFTLEEGDLLYTGTPEGVGRVVAGDVITASLEGHISITHAVAAAEPGSPSSAS
jgi:2-keto-4-pentenoate hydratase/2-oxohepta-3-ene-1,7-dioic acid hydratase in catechol pathway